MKRISSSLLIAIIMLTLCACSKKPERIGIEYDGEEVTELELYLGDGEEENDIIVNAVFEPEGADSKIEWSSSDRDVIRVKNLEDGSCRIRLHGEGEAKVTAECGKLAAEVKITVAPDGWRPEKGVMFTPDELIASDNLMEDYELCGKYTKALETHINAARNNSGTVTGDIALGDGDSAYYGMSNGVLTAIRATHNSTSTKLNFNFNEDGFSESVTATVNNAYDYRIGVNSSGENITSISICEGDSVVSETAIPGEKLAIKEDNGGFSIRFEDNAIIFEMGVRDEDSSVMTVKLQSESGKGLKLAEVEARLAINSAAYSIKSENKSNHFTADEAKILCRGNLNGYDYTAAVDIESGELTVTCEDFEDYGVTLCYTVNSDLELIDAVCIRQIDGKEIAINSDGSERRD